MMQMMTAEEMISEIEEAVESLERAAGRISEMDEAAAYMHLVVTINRLKPVLQRLSNNLSGATSQ
jgi:hypothetical protein